MGDHSSRESTGEGDRSEVGEAGALAGGAPGSGIGRGAVTVDAPGLGRGVATSPGDAASARWSLGGTASMEGEPEPRGREAIELGSFVAHFQLRRELGCGASGRVMLARDSKLHRSVALKLFAAGRHAERFLAEARIIARLDHPNIVKLWDYGEADGRLYLALEYVEGVTLEERMHGEALALQESFRVLRAIADALEHAHASGVVHCDLKPGNVMIGRDGRVRVVDFGIAQTDEMESRGGTPEWMAPEQWERHERTALTDRVDSWALGVIAFQLCTGTHPVGDTHAARLAFAASPEREVPVVLSAELPAVVRELIRRALVRQPSLRPSMAEWQRGLEEAISGRGDSFFEDGPYPGLAAFDEQRARYFFGREAEIDELVERLRHVPYLPIVGPSGVGKSSFLHAGLVPRLCAREPHLVLAMRPGTDPVGALARELLRAAKPATGAAAIERGSVRALRADLLETPALLASRLVTLAKQRDARVLLAVDQLEETFTHCAVEHEREQFLAMLRDAVDDASDPARVVCTVRDDFIGRLAVREVYVLQPLGATHLRQVVVEPLRRCQYGFDDATVVDELIREVMQSSVAELPLLQFACRTLWNGRDKNARLLLRSTYEEMGGVVGALARHAERAIAGLDPGESRLARRLLLALVSGSARRSVPRQRLLEQVGKDAAPLMDRLREARLLVQRTQDDSDGPIIEIAHESLLQSWKELARWIEESRDERRFIDEHEEAAEVWEKRGHRPIDTYSHNQLVAARQRARDLRVELPARLQAFFAAGDARVRAARRRRRGRTLLAIAVLVVASIPLLTAAAKFLAREQLIRVNAGTIDLVLTAYDWRDGQPVPVPMSELPELTLHLHAAQELDRDEPGAPLPAEVLSVTRRAGRGGARIERVTAPGGVIFLRVAGRGRGGQRCNPSWIRLLSFPGYGGRRAVPRWTLAIPTCQATYADMLLVEAGPFIYGGPGEPPSAWYGKHADYTWPERTRELPAYWLDRTEVSNARFAPFAALEPYTGYLRPVYSNDAVHRRDAEPKSPVTEINAFTARAFCRYLGKELPTDPQWVKAARGGLMLGGRPNPAPRRLYPWGSTARRECLNVGELEGGHDGYVWVAPVESFECGASPYGFLNLSGNAQEWISRVDQPDPDNPQYVIRSGAVDSPPSLDQGSTVFVNHRSPRNFDYSIGVRCAMAAEE